MPIMFVHGVNTREGPSYTAGENVIRFFLTRHFGGATFGGKTFGDPPRVEFPYWGDLGATFAWGGRALPRDVTEALATVSGFDLSLALGQLAEVVPRGPISEPLTILA